jgi:uncharacterized protein (DUF1778 family)
MKAIMASSSNPSAQYSTISLRTSEDNMAIIDRAAAALGKTRAEFLLEFSRHAAEEILLSGTFFVTEDAAYEQLVDLEDTHTPSTGALRTLLRTAAPWE